MNVPTRIDVHYHPMAPAWLADAGVTRSLAPMVRPIAAAWSPSRALADLDRHGIATAITSVSNPGVWFGDPVRARTLARKVNEHAAGLAREHPSRFLGLAALPLPDVDGTLAEVDHALDELGLVGVSMLTSVAGRGLADPETWPVWAELDRRRAVVLVHPTTSATWAPLAGVPAPLWDYHAETGRALLQWVLTDASIRFPHVRIVFSHAAGPVLTSIGRLQLMAAARPELELPHDLTERIGRLYVEVSTSTDDSVLGVLDHYLPTDHVLLGTDSPFVGDLGATINQLERQSLPPGRLAAIEHLNARALFGLPADETGSQQ